MKIYFSKDMVSYSLSAMIVLVMLIASTADAISSFSIDQRTGIAFRAFSTDGGVGHLVERESDPNMGMYIALRRVAPRAEYTIPNRRIAGLRIHLMDPTSRLVAVSGATAIELSDYDPRELASGLSLDSALMRAEGRVRFGTRAARTIMRYQVYTLDDDIKRLVLVMRNDRLIYFVDERILG